MLNQNLKKKNEIEVARHHGLECNLQMFYVANYTKYLENLKPNFNMILSEFRKYFVQPFQKIKNKPRFVLTSSFSKDRKHADLLIENNGIVT